MGRNVDDPHPFEVGWVSFEKRTAVGFESFLALQNAEGYCALCCSVKALLKPAEDEVTFKTLLSCYKIGQVAIAIRAPELELCCWKFK